MKTCSRCGVAKPLDQFRRDANRPDGRRAACKSCTNAEDKLYRDQTYDPAHKAEIAKRYRECHPDSLTNQRQEYRAKNPEKDHANNLVNKAVASGTLERPGTCSWCGVGGRIEGAHVDYYHPYDVTWVCVRCHRKLDAALAPLRESVERLTWQLHRYIIDSQYAPHPEEWDADYPEYRDAMAILERRYQERDA